MENETGRQRNRKSDCGKQKMNGWMFSGCKKCIRGSERKEKRKVDTRKSGRAQFEAGRKLAHNGY